MAILREQVGSTFLKLGPFPSAVYFERANQFESIVSSTGSMDMAWPIWPTSNLVTDLSNHQSVAYITSRASCDAENTIWKFFLCKFFGANGCLENCGHRLGCDYKEDASSYLVGNFNDTHGQEKRRDIFYRNTVRQLGRLIWTKYIITWLQIYKYNFTDTNWHIQIHKYMQPTKNKSPKTQLCN